VAAGDPLATAAALMDEHGLSSIIMVGPNGRARGYVDVDTARAGNGKVGEIHATLPTTVNIDEDLRTAVSTMFKYDVTWLACVDGDGTYKGYVTLPGITHLLGEAHRDG
jgi:osmoprotectant transport system ATP-binding protein